MSAIELIALQQPINGDAKRPDIRSDAGELVEMNLRRKVLLVASAGCVATDYISGHQAKIADLKSVPGTQNVRGFQIPMQHIAGVDCFQSGTNVREDATSISKADC